MPSPHPTPPRSLACITLPHDRRHRPRLQSPLPLRPTRSQPPRSPPSPRRPRPHHRRLHLPLHRPRRLSRPATLPQRRRPSRHNLSPVELLHQLLAIEHAMGRDRSTAPPKGPRIIDLDLLLVGNIIIQSPELTLPHPALHERRFVLAPLSEIAPRPPTPHPPPHHRRPPRQPLRIEKAPAKTSARATQISRKLERNP